MAQRRILDLTEAAAPKDDMFVPVDHGNDGTQRISTAALLANKANIDGLYEGLTSGNTLQMISSKSVVDQEPYNFRTSGGTADIGNRSYDTIVGGSLVWNQLIPTASRNFVSTNDDTREYVQLAVRSFEAPYVQMMQSVAISSTGKRDFLLTLQASTFGKGLYIVHNGVVRNIAFYIGRDTELVYGHRYILSMNFTGVDPTTVGGVKAEDIQFTDLTAMLGTANADHIYTLEQANAGAGVAYFKKYFPEEYHEFCEPHFEHVQVSAKNTVGFNQWDEEWEKGRLNTQGEPQADNSYIRSKNFIPILPSTQYCIGMSLKGASAAIGMFVFYYDGNQSFISAETAIYSNWADSNFLKTTPANAHYAKFYISSNYGTTYKNDICINLSWSGTRNGEYEAYQKRTYPIEPIVLRGIPKIDETGKLYFDGDEYEHDGTVTRRYGIVDLGTLTWGQYNNTFYANLPDIKRAQNSTSLANVFCTKLVTTSSSNVLDEIVDKSICANTTIERVNAYDSAYTTAADFKTAMNGVYLIYELATPTTETAEPFQSPMVVDDWGTEELVDYGVEQGTRDVAIPVGHSSEYPPNQSNKLDHLPTLASADGRYCVQQTGTQMALVADTSPGRLDVLEIRVPAPPTTDGTYTLKVVVAVGNPTFSWVSE